ncbi:bacteriorhodopsin [Micromonospora sp. DT46]|uniref:bacteriorhodopsin n=1 Tax=unclassified Micromonospora TaxID=2617518 RepID=UPI001788BB6E|nr:MULTISPECIES: bacteriorhodopsin [unclassified Micromonospora]WSG02619.1 bacteriorhodopsin [Micromonospora sp. NBC_01740]
MTEWWLWMYVAAMAGGVVLFSRWRADPRGVPRSEYRVAIAIPLWSGSWYLLMALGGGRTEVAGHTLYWARYVDWVVTAPLLLVALMLTATHSLPGRCWRLMGVLAGANVVVILSGLFADLTADGAARYTLYAIGVLALLAVYALIWGPLRAHAHRQPEEIAGVYTEAALLLSALWAGYPVFWILGPSGVGLFSSATTSLLLVVLSIVSKVGWSILDLGRLRALSNRGHLTVV